MSLGILMSLKLESTVRGRELEGPQEVVGSLEVGTAGNNLVDEIFNASDTFALELFVEESIIGSSSEGKSLLVGRLDMTSLVDELGDGLSGRITISDEGLDDTDHVPGGLVELHEHGVVELSQSKELEDLLGLWGKLVDTSDPDQKSNLGLSLNVELVGGLGISLLLNKSSISSSVFLEIFLGVGISDLSGSGSGFLGLS